MLPLNNYTCFSPSCLFIRFLKFFSLFRVYLCRTRVIPRSLHYIFFNRWERYPLEGEWSGLGDENCTNPSKLYESVVAKPDDFLIRIKYSFFGDQDAQNFYPEIPSKVWSFVDGSYEDKHHPNGRCFTAKPMPDMISYGIDKILLYTSAPTIVYFHNPHIFATDRQKTGIQLAIERKLEVDVEHEVFKMLDFGGEPCTNNVTYKKDLCVYKEVDKISIEKYGCTTPYGLQKTKICKDNVNGSEVLKQHFKALYKNKHSCMNPCEVMSIRAFVRKDSVWPSVDGKKVGLMKIYFKQNIKVTKGLYLYSTLSLIAEIGGYVGLFLGVSVNQISWLIDVMFTKIERLYFVK